MKTLLASVLLATEMLGSVNAHSGTPKTAPSLMSKKKYIKRQKRISMQKQSRKINRSK